MEMDLNRAYFGVFKSSLLGVVSLTLWDTPVLCLLHPHFPSLTKSCLRIMAGSQVFPPNFPQLPIRCPKRTRALAQQNRSDFCDLRLRCPSWTPEIASETLHCDLRVRWKVASDLRFRAAISEPKAPSF